MNNLRDSKIIGDRPLIKKKYRHIIVTFIQWGATLIIALFSEMNIKLANNSYISA